MLDGFLVVAAYLGQTALDIVSDLGLGDAKLVGDGLFGLSGHLHLEDLGASILCRQSLAVIQSHDLVTPPNHPGRLTRCQGDTR